MRYLLTLLTALWIGNTATAQPVMRSLPQAVQLQQDGALSLASQHPVILFFTLPGCSYCRIVRYDYLQPMMAERSERDGVLLREVSVTGERVLRASEAQKAAAPASAPAASAPAKS